MEKLVEKVVRSNETKKGVCLSIGVTIRYKDRKTITRSKKLLNPISKQDEIYQMGKKLLLKNWNGDPDSFPRGNRFRSDRKKQAVNSLIYFHMKRMRKKNHYWIPSINCGKNMENSY